MAQAGNGSSSGPGNGRQVGIVGAAIVPHAPQFLSLPPSEDHAQVARVKAAMQAVGEGLRALKPDLVIVISNCHGEEMVVHIVPPFTLHCGDRAAGMDGHLFALHRFGALAKAPAPQPRQLELQLLDQRRLLFELRGLMIDLLDVPPEPFEQSARERFELIDRIR